MNKLWLGLCSSTMWPYLRKLQSMQCMALDIPWVGTMPPIWHAWQEEIVVVAEMGCLTCGQGCG